MMFFCGMFCVLSAPARTCNETREDGILLISMDRIKRDGGRRWGFDDLPPLEACIHDDLKHHLVNPNIPQAFIVEGNNLPQPNPLPAADTHGNRDRPSPHRLMQLKHAQALGGRRCGHKCNQSSRWKCTFNPPVV